MSFLLCLLSPSDSLLNAYAFSSTASIVCENSFAGKQVYCKTTCSTTPFQLRHSPRKQQPRPPPNENFRNSTVPTLLRSLASNLARRKDLFFFPFSVMRHYGTTVFMTYLLFIAPVIIFLCFPSFLFIFSELGAEKHTHTTSSTYSGFDFVLVHVARALITSIFIGVIILGYFGAFSKRRQPSAEAGQFFHLTYPPRQPDLLCMSLRKTGKCSLRKSTGLNTFTTRTNTHTHTPRCCVKLEVCQQNRTKLVS